ncbi:MAG TPA: hypothetical protein VF848_03805 [Steroidobacteraceae bacterium]
MIFGLLAAAAALPGSVAAEDALPGGVWQKHEYELHYMGFTSRYSCDGLEGKLQLLLKAAGARDDVRVSAAPCDRPDGHPTRFAAANMTFYTLVPASAGSGATTAAATTPAMWRTVKLADHSPSPLQGGDCELVAEFRDQILPMFTTRNVVDNMSCVPYEEHIGQLNLSFDVLTSAPVTPAAH